jgi:mRNA-degrading endonuclease HigB of HigAB toxin-antitoxin module
MHVISRKKLREFWQQHGDTHDALDNWYKNTLILFFIDIAFGYNIN